MMSFIDVAKELFENSGESNFFLLSERFSQDPLENFFGQHRAHGRRSDNPSVFQFVQNTSSIRASIRPVMLTTLRERHGVRQRELLTVTDRRAYWVQPTYVKDVPYAPVRDINFTERKGFKAAHENMCAIDPPPPPPPPPTPPQQQQQHQQLLKRPSVDAQNAFLAALAGSSVKSAVLAVTRDYHESYIPQAMQDNFPEPLMNL